MAPTTIPTSDRARQAADPAATIPADERRRSLLDAFRATRALTLALTEPLEPEDFRIQSMPDVSPPWWNLGHTSWFFARNILAPRDRYPDWFERLEYPLNSYYEGLGPRLERSRRGLATRPTTAEILAYRQAVDERIETLLTEAPADELDEIGFLVRTGIEHEQQHQELLVTEMKHILWQNPPELRRGYGAPARSRETAAPPLEMIGFEGGLVEIGDGSDGWVWDNERPRHKAWLDEFELASRLATNGEYLEFMADGGYRQPLLWLSNGWAAVRAEGWRAPLYWEPVDGAGPDAAGSPAAWRIWTLHGLEPLDPDEPVAHVSFYEADAYARWRAAQGGACEGVRLPTEQEWEHGAATAGFDPASGNMLDTGLLHPRRAAPAATGSPLLQTAGDLWEWTASHYEPYPGYRPFKGDLMEYNGKFMDNQRVLRGGSAATPASHVRASYRNFWPGPTRFQMTGIRLAR